MDVSNFYLYRKFDSYEVLTRTNGVIMWALSQRRTRWKCIDGKDAVCPYQDEKTPWSFTTALHCSGLQHV